MKVKFYPRESVIVETSTQYDVVVLEAVNDLYDKVGDNPKLRRNPNLDAQLTAVRKFGVPILFRVVVNAQWYSDNVLTRNGMEDKAEWGYWMDKWLLDDVSAMLLNPHRAHGFLLTAAIDQNEGTTSAWVKTTMLMAGNFFFEKWKLPIWYEFAGELLNTAWDKGEGGKYGQMQQFLEGKEWVDRVNVNPMLAERELTFPDNTLEYLPEIGTPEVPVPEGGFVLPIEPLSQVDPRWKDVQLGTSSSTIGGYGCLVTSVAMMLDYYGYTVDPAELDTMLTDNAGYANGNLLVWGAIPAIFPGVTYDGKWEGSRNDVIDKCLAEGKPVLIHVDFVPSTATIEQHWCLVVGKDSNGYIINDPKDGLQLSFAKRYGDPATKIYNVASYDASIPEVDPPDEWIPSDDMDKALLCLPDILTEAKRTNVLLESVYKLLEANLFRGRL